MKLTTKTRLFALSSAVAALMTTASVAAQDFTFGWNPRSGDVWVDQRLGDINQYGTRYREPFIDEMTRYYGAPRDLVSDLVVRQRWAPGDVYYACSIAQQIGRPCRYVVDEWNRDHGQGWGVMAQRLGIKPGSAEFHRLKKGFVPTYDRWSRPVVLDVDLRREFPNHGKVKNKTGKPVKASAMSGNGKDHGNAKSGANRGKDHGNAKSGGGNKKSSGKPDDKGNGKK
ncbi:MAG: hypothetical protein LH470_10885 [Lysobacter sp.]|nr:hypothetical protein [Lysobacter sp.]